MEIEKFDYCQIAELSDIGRKRQANEDSCGHRDTVNGRVVTVCDGMGGAVGGATASSIAVSTILDFLSREYIEDANLAIIQAIDSANRAIIAEGQRNPKLQGMGTTCVLLLVRNGKVYIGSVGDSRVYIVQNHNAIQLTKDQSYVQMLVDSHAITAQQARTHPRRNEITNALGMQNMQPATVLSQNPISTKAGDCFLLCSDGLSGMVDDEKIGRIVSKYDVNIKQRAKMLIDEANKNGGTDNITVQIVEFPTTYSQDDRKKLSKRNIFILIGIVALCAIVAALLILKFTNKNKGEDVVTSTTTSIEQRDENIKSPTLFTNDTTINLQGTVSYSKGAAFLLVNISKTEIVISADNNILQKILGKFNKDSVDIKYPTDYVSLDNNNVFRWTDKNYNKNTFEFSIKTDNKKYNYSIQVKPKVVIVPDVKSTKSQKNTTDSTSKNDTTSQITN